MFSSAIVDGAPRRSVGLSGTHFDGVDCVAA